MDKRKAKKNNRNLIKIITIHTSKNEKKNDFKDKLYRQSGNI